MLNIENTKKIAWYRQQTGAVPYFAYRPSCGCVAGFKQREQIYWLCNLEEARAYLDKDLIGKMAMEYLAKEEGEPGNLAKMFAEWVCGISQVNQGLFDEIDSRELKIPCIIGTQIATKKLKDGDKVLVNANHGVVVVRE